MQIAIFCVKKLNFFFWKLICGKNCQPRHQYNSTMILSEQVESQEREWGEDNLHKYEGEDKYELAKW